MIKTRPRPSLPQTLKSDKVCTTKQDLARKIADGESLQKKDFPAHWSGKDANDVKKALWKFHRGKCCYCEGKRDPKWDSDVEHFRPKAKVDDLPEHPGYWWLAYDWENYFLSCKCCNSDHKRNRFPLLDEAHRATQPEDAIGEEQPILINPETENPEEFIGFDWRDADGLLVKAVGKDLGQRGKRTICILGLNRQLLLEERAAFVEMLDQIVCLARWGHQEGISRIVEIAERMIQEETSSERPFLGFRRAFFREADLSEYVAND